ncbi:MAG TPA: hypothetical protein VMP01_15115 [Pirellulaceae bacterium]|nr:hypothetical protein [Pirellulaceae bacterium]
MNLARQRTTLTRIGLCAVFALASAQAAAWEGELPPSSADTAILADDFPPSIVDDPNRLATSFAVAPCQECQSWHHVGGKARGYFVTDQRYEFTGQETTFAVEGVVDGGYHRMTGDWELSMDGELFLNLPFDRNLLVDTPERRSFAANFDIDPVQISQLTLGARRDDWYLAIGRFVTPFGRFYFPQYRNDFSDAPFIRSEAVLFRETGVLAQWDPEGYVFTAAITNGGFGQDTNASKALVARAGIDRENFALGSSVKWHDGISSEGQKQYNRHVGVDAMLRRGRWILSGEAIYDQYGFRRPGFDQSDIFWGRSIYFRDLNDGLYDPIEGAGYYVDLGYDGDFWSASLNFGSYFPERIGNVPHDRDVHRGLVKLSWHPVEHFEIYSITLVESDGPLGFATRSHRRGVVAILGCQWSL